MLCPFDLTDLLQDSFINLAKQGLDTYSQSHSDVRKTGGEEFNSPDNSAPGSGGRTNINHDEAIQRAQEHGSGDKDLFQTAMGFLGNNKDDHEKPIDEDEVTNAHRKAYDEGNTSGLSASSLGGAAALQVLKQFTSGGKSGGSQTELISMAMAEATKLFDKSGGGSSGNKQDAVNGAAMTVMKLLVQSKFGGGGSLIGGGNSGGLGGLMSLASQFAK
ncbi:hypothetical protein C0989_003808 [Termitomyces sp. Mn162]|nr:hypothetical protein C0989_003808 [Termitomyces sp. Mn162]